MKFLIVFALCLTAILATPYSSRLVKSPPKGRIIGGDRARAGQFPFAAYIEINTSTSQLTCGGVLLNNEWVLTSATCVDGAILFRIQLGSTQREGIDAARVTVVAEDYVLHPDYDRETQDNDLGLIKLRMPITFSDYLKPVSFLPVVELTSSAPATIMGWGQISDDIAGDVNDLRYARVVALSNEECQLTYGSAITKSMVCVDGNFNEGTCIGDSGTPLVQIIGMDHSVLVGISSFHSAYGCERPDPSGFARVFPAKEWITNVTGFA